jgi:C4-type Zn-finger protein
MEVKENEEIEYRIQKRPRKRRDQEVGDEMGRQDLEKGVLMTDTEIEVILDMDHLPKHIGMHTPSGKTDFDQAAVDEVLEWAREKIEGVNDITVVLRGYCPHAVLVQLQHMIEMTDNVTRYDFVPIGGMRFTVFDYVEEIAI